MMWSATWAFRFEFNYHLRMSESKRPTLQRKQSSVSHLSLFSRVDPIGITCCGREM